MTDASVLDVSGHPILDSEGTVLRLKGDKEFLLTLFEVYLEDLPEKLSAIRTALADGDLETILRSAHSLKGASATVGATAMREVAYALETAARDGDAERVGRLGALLDVQAELLQSELKAAIAG